MRSKELFHILTPRAKFSLLAAIFFVFAPVSLLAVSGLGHGWRWIDIAGWMIGSALIATSWAYAAFKGRHFWLPAVCNTLIPLAQGVFLSGSITSGSAGVTPAAMVVVASIVIGYVMFVVFIRGEGARTMHLATEMELAKEIHDHLVPEVQFRDEQFEILGSSSPSSEVGGDLLDLSQRNQRLHITVADVSGHGVRAGVLMAMIKSALRTKLLDHNCASVCDDLNTVIYSLKRPDMYATATVLELLPDRRVQFTGAGHPDVLQISGVDGTCSGHSSQNPPLGVVPGIPYASSWLTLEPGDLLVILTDGLIEVENQAGEMFGEQRIRQLIQGNASGSLAEIRSALLDAVHQWGKQTDDQTLVLVRAR